MSFPARGKKARQKNRRPKVVDHGFLVDASVSMEEVELWPDDSGLRPDDPRDSKSSSTKELERIAERLERLAADATLLDDEPKVVEPRPRGRCALAVVATLIVLAGAVLVATLADNSSNGNTFTPDDLTPGPTSFPSPLPTPAPTAFP